LSTLTEPIPEPAIPATGRRRDACHLEVLEQAGLIGHVAEQHDRIAVPGLQHRGELERLITLAVSVAEDDVCPRRPASRASASSALARNGSVMSRTIAPVSIVGAPRSARASGFGR
jgi:hypothetical protein